MLHSMTIQTMILWAIHAGLIYIMYLIRLSAVRKTQRYLRMLDLICMNRVHRNRFEALLLFSILLLAIIIGFFLPTAWQYVDVLAIAVAWMAFKGDLRELIYTTHQHKAAAAVLELVCVCLGIKWEMFLAISLLTAVIELAGWYYMDDYAYTDIINNNPIIDV